MSIKIDNDAKYLVIKSYTVIIPCDEHGYKPGYYTTNTECLHFKTKDEVLKHLKRRTNSELSEIQIIEIGKILSPEITVGF